MFAGLGLFFFAMHFLCVNLRRLADQKLKRRIARITSTAPAGLSVGMLMIVLTQSGTAAVFLLVGLVRAGMMTLRQVQPVILGLNLGAGLIILFLTLDIRIAVMILIGVSGILYAFGSRHKEHVTGAAIGVGLLFLGFQIMRDAASQIETQAWFLQFVEVTAGAPFLAFLAGMFLTILAQSSIAVAAVMIVFLQSGLFELQDGILFVFGANIGSSVLMLLLSASLSGVQRQVALYKLGFNAIAALVLLPMMYIEAVFGVPLIVALVSHLSADPGTQVALAYVLFNALPVPVLLLLLGPTADYLQKLSPETRAELGAKPKHLVSPRPELPSVVQRLVELELVRLLRLKSEAFQSMRSDRGSRDLHASLEAASALHKTIEETLRDMASDRSLSVEEHGHVDLLGRILYLTQGMREALHALGADVIHLRKSRPEMCFADSAVEGLDAILNVLISVARDRDSDTLEVLTRLTSAKGNGINAIKVAYLQDEQLLIGEARSRFLSAISLCERLIWLFGETSTAYGRLGLCQVEVLPSVFEQQGAATRLRA
ncbi:Na/Pi cotransporter family protein [Roseibium sp.]|uniref:Na/Pi cotransporter family protein n=1 Tax=Roseibium sp. TaxID=1936156 RepID=UPI003B505C0F